MTPAGETLYRASEKILATINQAESDAEWLSGDNEKTLRLCVGFYSNYTWFPDFLRHWREVNATTHVCIVSDAKQHSLEALRKGVIDICLLPFEPAQQDLLSVKLFQDELVLTTQPSPTKSCSGPSLPLGD